MYASKRSVRKAQGYQKKYKEPTHGNRETTKGGHFRVQVVKDKFGIVTKRIVHYSEKQLKRIAKYQKLLAEYRMAQMEAYKEQQQEGENDVKSGGMASEAAALEKTVELHKEPVVATE